MFDHESAVKNGRVPQNNKFLFRKIKKILSLGLSIEYKKIYENLDEKTSLLREIEDVKKYKKNIDDLEAGEVIKRSIDAGKELVQGEDGDNRPYKPSDVKVFSKEDEDTETVKAYRERLKNLGIESSGTGKYSSSDDEATKRAMTYLATVTGKTYGTDDEAFKDFQRDLGMFDANRDKIKELIK